MWSNVLWFCYLKFIYFGSSTFVMIYGLFLEGEAHNLVNFVKYYASPSKFEFVWNPMNKLAKINKVWQHFLKHLWLWLAFILRLTMTTHREGSWECVLCVNVCVCLRYSIYKAYKCFIMLWLFYDTLLSIPHTDPGQARPQEARPQSLLRVISAGKEMVLNGPHGYVRWHV